MFNSQSYLVLFNKLELTPSLNAVSDSLHL